MKDETEKFLSIKEDVLNNIAVLRINLEKCVEFGMEDPSSNMYNQINELSDYVKTIDSYPDLEEAVEQAKAIEEQIDNWLTTQGAITVSLSWPTF